MSELAAYSSLEGVAIIGMAGRFPKAKGIGQFWQNLKNGLESISFFSDEELVASGIDAALLSNPDYVKSGFVLQDVDLFDAGFFGYNPREAEMLDPQHRFFLECSWEALENAGYNPLGLSDPVGVYAGTSKNTYLLNNLRHRFDNLDEAGNFQAMIGNNTDFLTTRLSYKLNLTGPSLDIQTACSTSLVAVQMAYQSLLSYQCDLALAGGVSISVPQKRGYLYQEGMIKSPDGHNRTFDESARGTVGGEGVGIVVLKRLEDAIEDQDHIYAVIKGAATNNDGAAKIGYTAPSVDGQSEVIAMAQALAGIEAESITYVETHGTATPMGDPIEIEALNQAFKLSTEKRGFCAIGSVKTNIGHLDAAAGVAGLIKTVLALHHKQIPPSLHFTKPNPRIDFNNSPFFVNTELTDWQSNEFPRRAGVSSFGIGGTNAHIVLEEAPIAEPSVSRRKWQLLPLSAKSATALDEATQNLAKHLWQHPDLNLADAAYTLQVGRPSFNHRRFVVSQNGDDAGLALETVDPKRVQSAVQEIDARPIVFMFTGQGSQYVNMGLGLYQSEPLFRKQVDYCARLLEPQLELDLRKILYPADDEIEAATEQLMQTAITQPALFVIEYALAQLLMTWGVRPQALIGHSIGEYVAACLAGVFSLEEALILVAARGRLMQELPGGSMLAVYLPDTDIQPLLSQDLSLATVNGPSLCVVSGPTDSVKSLQKRLNKQGVDCRFLHTSHAFHSQMMDPILALFADQVSKINLRAPAIPFISNVSGTWITDTEAKDPGYWVRHIRQTVRFSEGAQRLVQDPELVLLEIGPGRTLKSLIHQQPQKNPGQPAISSLRPPHDNTPDMAYLLNAIGQLWLSGVGIDWTGFHANDRLHRLPLPGYPFERQRFWVDSKLQESPAKIGTRTQRKNHDLAEWFYIPSWNRTPSPRLETTAERFQWLLFMDDYGLGKELANRLRGSGQDVIEVIVGKQFNQLGDGIFTINPLVGDDYTKLLEALRNIERVPNRIVHLWSITSDDCQSAEFDNFDKAQNMGFYSLLFLAQAVGRLFVTDRVHLEIISNNIQEVIGNEVLCPSKATVLGACRVIPQEYSNIYCRNIDVVLPDSENELLETLINQLFSEIWLDSFDNIVAYRGIYRWTQNFIKTRMKAKAELPSLLKEHGVYLITGGLGNVGFALAQYLAQNVRAKLVLIGRTPLPLREEWRQWLELNGEEDSVSKKIQQVLALEELGAEVLVFGANVADDEQMEAVVAQVNEHFGPLNGVIHAAGTTDQETFLNIEEISRFECEKQFEPKVRGALVLEKKLRGKNIDFFLLTSSLSSVLGGLTFVAYSAANLYLDSFANRQNQIDTKPWITINWDSWRFTDSKEIYELFNTNRTELEMAPFEGVETFKRILTDGTAKQVVVSVGDLKSRMDQWVNLPFKQPAETNYSEDESSLHSRPNLLNDYIPPNTEIEERIVIIWQSLLGIERVGIHDDFFELGGHSLLATQVITRIRAEFSVEITLRKLLEIPTVFEVAKYIEAMLSTIQDLEFVSDYTEDDEEIIEL